MIYFCALICYTNIGFRLFFERSFYDGKAVL